MTALVPLLTRDFRERSCVKALLKAWQMFAVATESNSIAHWMRSKASVDGFKVRRRIACLTPQILALLTIP